MKSYNIGNMESAVSRIKTPIFKIEYYDTPYAVPSLGYVCEYFYDTARDSSITFETGNIATRGRDNILAYYWGLGAPPGVSDASYFKARYYGYFYANFTGEYKFFVSKEPSDYIYFIMATGSSDPTDIRDESTYTYSSSINEWGSSNSFVETTSGTFSLTAGRWYPFVLKFAQREKESYLGLQYLEPNSVTGLDGLWSDNDTYASGHREAVSHKKILSAGICNYSDSWSDRNDAEFITPIVLSGVLSASYSKESNQSATLEFTVPILSNVSTTSGLNGYRFDRYKGYYTDDTTGVSIRNGRYVKYYTGYYYNGDATDYIQRFEGIIVDKNVSKSDGISSISELKIGCQDILYYAVNSINENYPNKLSYALNQFTSESAVGQPNGKTRPITYDSWPVVNVIRDMFIKAGIDPIKLYSRKQFILRNSATATGWDYDYGDYLIEDRNIILKRKTEYGNPYMGDSSDDKYIWKFDFGDSIFDNITRIADNYGYVTEVDCDGNILYSSINSPNVDVVETGSNGWESYGTWAKTNTLKAEGGRYYTASSSGDIISKTVVGSKFVVNRVLDITSVETDINKWSVIENDYPRDRIYDSNRGNKVAPKVYGRSPLLDFDGTVTGYITNSLIVFVRPQKNISVTDVKYSYKFDTIGAIGIYDNALQFDKMKCKVYIGQITEGSPYVLQPGYTFCDKDAERGLDSSISRLYEPTLKHTFSLETGYMMYSGYTYGVLFTTYLNGLQTDDYTKRDLFGGICRCEESSDGLTHMSWYTSLVTSNGTTVTAYLTSGTDKDLGVAAYPDIELLSTDPVSTITVYSKDAIGDDYSTEVFSTNVNNVYYDPYGSGLRYLSDGADFSGINPCSYTIYAENIGYTFETEESISLCLPYGNYKIEVTNLSNTYPTRINSIESYDTDINNHQFYFDTTSNIFSIGVADGIDDIRNDVIVVGDLIGAFRDYITDQVVNPNNPINQYIYSRATDISSIHDPDSINSIGRKKPFVVFEPSIVDQKHADWLAQAILYRYRSMKNMPQWETVGIPFLETDDNVVIDDIYSQGVIGDNGNSEQWIASISESMSNGNYTLSLQTTPYAPWSSFVQTVNPEYTDFGYPDNPQPFINIRMTDSHNTLRGYKRNNTYIEGERFDVYEAESGNRLKVTYDQVIDGDIIVEVIANKVLDNPIMGETVAYLVGGIKDGLLTPEYREWGANYELYWDGIDQTGAARRCLARQDHYTTTGGISVVINDEDYITSFSEPGFYCPSGEYAVRFTIFPRNQEYPSTVIDTNNLRYEYNSEIADRLGKAGATGKDYSQRFSVSWGDTPTVLLLVSGQIATISGGNVRDITYYPNNTFYSNEFNNQGIKFDIIPETSISSIKPIYFKVDFDHIWAAGITFLLRDTDPRNMWPTLLHSGVISSAGYNTTSGWALDWLCSYLHETVVENTAKKSGATEEFGGDVDHPYEGTDAYISQQYSHLVVGDPSGDHYDEMNRFEPGLYDITYKPLIGGWAPTSIYDPLDYSNSDLMTDIIEAHPHNKLTVDSMPLIVEETIYCEQHLATETRYRVIVYGDTPYTTYKINPFIDTVKHYLSDDNPFTFYYNPALAVGGQWYLEALPDMSDGRYETFRNMATLCKFYAGPQAVGDTTHQNNPDFITSHAFQARISIWDATGRIIKSNKQKIAYEASGHTHNLWHLNDTGNISMSVDNDESISPKTIKIEHHTHDNSNKIVFSPKGFGASIEVTDKYYDMIISGMSSYGYSNNRSNYGIGYCNLPGSHCYGQHTWHGYWKQIDTTNLLNYQVPFNHINISQTSHWIKYPSGENLIYAIPEFLSQNYMYGKYGNVVYGSDPDGVYGSMSLDNTLKMKFAYYDCIPSKIELKDSTTWLVSGLKHTHLPIYEGMNGILGNAEIIKIGINNLTAFDDKFAASSYAFNPMTTGMTDLKNFNPFILYKFDLQFGNPNVEITKYLRLTSLFGCRIVELNELVYDNSFGWQDFCLFKSSIPSLPNNNSREIDHYWVPQNKSLVDSDFPKIWYKVPLSDILPDSGVGTFTYDGYAYKLGMYWRTWLIGDFNTIARSSSLSSFVNAAFTEGLSIPHGGYAARTEDITEKGDNV